MGLGGWDWIYDFNAAEGDRVDVSAIDADTTAFGRQHFVYVGDIGGAAPGRGQVSWDASLSTLVFNNDADAAPEGFIGIYGGGAPAASWLML
jgi:serralysin